MQVDGKLYAGVVGMEPEEQTRAIYFLRRFAEGPKEEAELWQEWACLILTPWSDQLAELASTIMASVQVNEKKVMMASIEQRRSFWSLYGRKAYPLLARCAQRLLSMHVTSAASERNWSIWGNIYTKYRANMSIKTAEKLVYIRGNSKVVEYTDDEYISLDCDA